jgi:hypothetical protein
MLPPDARLACGRSVPPCDLRHPGPSESAERVPARGAARLDILDAVATE